MNAKLRKEAEDLGIAVDSRWSDTTLRQRIDEKKADNEAQGFAGGIGGTNDGPSDEAALGAPMSDEGDRLTVEATPKAVHSASLPALTDKLRLMVKAEELNIMVDPEWDEERLKAEIQQALEGRADLQVKGAVPPAAMSQADYDAATKAQKEGLFPVILKADYWPAEGDRRPAGTPLWMSKAEAKRLMEAGVADRNDPI